MNGILSYLIAGFPISFQGVDFTIRFHDHDEILNL